LELIWELRSRLNVKHAMKRMSIGHLRAQHPAVVIPVMTQHFTMLQRYLLYTGVTGGKKFIVLIGQAKAIAFAVRNVSGRRRCSKLDE
jgi:exodeoxyribonuclease V alpha subunit